MTRQMTTIMPLMFGIFALSFASGLSIYFIASNLIGMAQYGMMGKVDIKRLLGRKTSEPEQEEKTTRPIQADKPKRAELDLELENPKRGRSPDLVIKPKRSGIRDTRVERAKAKSKAKG
ncbi:MAG: hypothetical protein JW910_18670, partial [Anaerolineae bacterium]|nr:hypothetical protein [Anaerolineae bacterium]